MNSTHQQSEASLAKQAKLLQAILDSSPASIALLSAVREQATDDTAATESPGRIIDFVYESASYQTGVIAGRPAQELLGRRFLDLFPGAIADGHFARYVNVVETGESFLEELPYLHPEEGVSGYFWMRVTKLDDAILQIVFDVTDRKRVELQAQEQAALTRLVMDASPAGISVFNALHDDANQVVDFRLLQANEAIARMSGSTVADLEGKLITETFPLYRSLGIYDRYQHVFTTGQPDRFEVHYNSEGVDGWLDISARRQGDAVVGTVMDVTPMRQAQRIEQQQNELLKSILDSTIMAIACYEAVRDEHGQIVDFRFIMANQTTLDVLGITSDELNSRTLCGINPSLQNSAALEQYRSVVETGKPVAMERELNGRYHYVSAVKFGDGMLTSSVDITENRLYRDQLEATNSALQQSNDNLQSFAYVASHDLQEPLRKIKSFGDIILNDYSALLPDEAQSMLRRMQVSAERMSALIHDLLTLSRLSTQRTPFIPIDLNRVLTGVLSDLEAVITEKSAVVNVADLPTVQGDGLQLRQLFQNLLSNALKFSEPGRSPRVSVYYQPIQAHSLPVFASIDKADQSQHYYAISVSDNGIGFDANKHGERIFGAFQRLHGRTSLYPGTGIGLAITKRVAENHGGGITVDSEEGKGATFTVYLPASSTV